MSSAVQSSVPVSVSISNARRALEQPRFKELWAIQSRFQRAMICALAVSTGGIYLASSSLDSNLIFVDFRNSKLIGVVKFESCFHVTAIIWVSDSLLYAGCNNGVLFAVTFHPTNKNPIFMRAILKPFNTPVNALSLDPIRSFLAVGSLGNMFIFSRSVYGDADSWTFVNHIPAPSEERHGLVTALGFYNTPTRSDQQLFIGYAKEGFCVWHGPHNYLRTPYRTDDRVCGIGSAALSSDGQFIAIVTLDHSIVIYPLTPDGPAVPDWQLLPNQEQSGPQPIVPIALADNLVLRGTTFGVVPIINLQSGPLPPIQDGSRSIIRALTVCVTAFTTTVLRSPHFFSKKDLWQKGCHLTLPDLAHARSLKEIDEPIFEVATGELEEQLGSYRTLDGLGFRKFDLVCKSLAACLSARILRQLRRPQTWRMFGMIWMLALILVVDPPLLPGQTNINPGTVQTQSRLTSTAMSTHRTTPRTEYPTLGYLISYGGRFVAVRFMWWGTWALAGLIYLVGQIFMALVWMFSIVPYTIQLTVTVVPAFLSAMICDVLQVYGDVAICPRPSDMA
ncbi:hypothetical protein FS749_016142 [Ceratobasidium sp. UAMH 11750]|nr:hypothetical protein FS749_016142 [Ceratobasidium sp. UAMH 11750]